MIAIADLQGTARECPRAAKLLRTRRSYDAAVYLCGYAVEIALKARICRALKWTTGFPAKGSEFKAAKSGLKTHDLEGLLEFTAIQDRIKLNHFTDWAKVNEWNPEQRYNPPGTKTLSQANDMIQATQNLLKVLL